MEILPLFNAVEKSIFALVDFKQLFELSCHSIFVELFVNHAHCISEEYG
jgi:hypothetical protein